MRHFMVPRLGRVLIVVAILSLAFPGAVAARKPANFTDTFANFSCEPVSTDDGTLILNVFINTEFPYADVIFWPAGTSPDTDPPALVSNGEPTYTLTATALSATVPMGTIDPETGETAPAGTATISATLTPVGDPIPVDEVNRFGNVRERREGFIQPIVASGTTTLPGGESFTFSGCQGETGTIQIFRTNPNSFVGTDRFITLFCELANEDGMAFVSADSHFVDVFLIPADNTPPLNGFAHEGGEGQITLTRSTFEAEIPLFVADTGEPAGTATIDASVTPTGDVARYRTRSQTGFSKFVEEALAVAGTLDFSTGQSFDLSSCVGTDVDVHFAFHNPQGPRPRGPAPVNDAPTGAIELSPGGLVRGVQTGGAALEAEEPCFFDEGQEAVPFGRTVWYTVEGTGGPITIDTARTPFDTVVAVYTREDGELVQIVCVDDVQVGRIAVSLQARVTFDTVRGETYYIQVGGFAAQWGRLTLRIR
ncbi:MAG: hypothetical protein H0X16_06925 [Chloroflexi bacterium]|nr:hypothetical protein [Chloroflexota bacterium]